MEKFRWGLMGAGRISGWFAAGLSAVPDAEIYAIGSRTQEKAEAFAAQYGVTKAYGSYEALLADDRIDVVYVGTPVRTHYECVKMCLEAGKHVLCEKTFTVNGREARELQALARAKGLFLMEAMWMKAQPANVEMRRWVRDGLLGEIRAVDATFYTKAMAGHRLYNHDIAGGALLDITVYPIAEACCMLGHAPSEICSTASICSARVDSFDSIVLRYPNGAAAHISGGLAPERTVLFYVEGTEGRILLTRDHFFQLERAAACDYAGNVLASVEAPFRKNGYEFEAEEVMRCIRAGKTESDLVPLSESIAVLEIMDECRRQWGFRYDFE